MPVRPRSGRTERERPARRTGPQGLAQEHACRPPTPRPRATSGAASSSAPRRHRARVTRALDTAASSAHAPGHCTATPAPGRRQPQNHDRASSCNAEFASGPVARQHTGKQQLPNHIAGPRINQNSRASIGGSPPTTRQIQAAIMCMACNEEAATTGTMASSREARSQQHHAVAETAAHASAPAVPRNARRSRACVCTQVIL